MSNRHADDLLNDIYGNALILFHEGRPDEEILSYTRKYLREAPLWLWKMPFRGYFGFYEYYGRRLMSPWLQGPDRQQQFQRFLEEQWVPSQLSERT